MEKKKLHVNLYRVAQPHSSGNAAVYVSLSLFLSVTLKLTGDIWTVSLPVIWHNSSFHMRHVCVNKCMSGQACLCLSACSCVQCVSAYVCISVYVCFFHQYVFVRVCACDRLHHNASVVIRQQSEANKLQRADINTHTPLRAHGRTSSSR